MQDARWHDASDTHLQHLAAHLQRHVALRQVQAKDELASVLRVLQQFPEADRAARLMRADEGLAYEEIAVALGLPVATVKVKVHRARLRLTKIRNQGVSA